jgi:cytidylate kinase
MDREIIAKAAERFGESLMELTHVTEEKPGLLERFTHTRDHYLSAVEATVLDMAARDDVILCGRSATLLLARFPHVFRVRITAPASVRAVRVANQHGLTPEAAADFVRQADHERAARVRFLYHVDWDDLLQYDMTLNTERITVEHAARVLAAALDDPRYRMTPEAKRELANLSLSALAKATLLANPATRPLRVFVTCRDGHCSVTGLVATEEQRQLVQDGLSALPGLKGLHNEVVPTRPIRMRSGGI